MNLDGRDVAVLAGAGAGGLLLGLAYFASLWWTVRRLAGARHPAALMAVGYAVRVAGLLGAVWLIGWGRWPRLVACLAGFVVGRMAATRMLGPSGAGPGERPGSVRESREDGETRQWK